MAKQEYYSLKNIISLEATYMLLLGERSNGKSYAVKYCSLWTAYHEADYNTYLQNGKIEHVDRYELGYIRRWRDEIKARDVEKYFDDMPIKEITENTFDSVVYYRGDLYFATTDAESGKQTRGKKIGSCFALTSATHYKSLAFPKIGNLVFEEFLTKDGYIPHEVDNLLSIVSTIARRDYVRVFMIGNSVNRLCPYFDEWSLTNIKNQQIGTIDIYNQLTQQEDEQGNQIIIKIAVEYCANSGNNSKMFFGNKAKNIVSGVWESDVHQHLEKPLNTYKMHYKILYKYNSFCFAILLLTNDANEPFLFVYPTNSGTRKVDRCVTTEFSTDRFTTKYLTELTKYDSLVLYLLTHDKVTYSDNLTGTEFQQIRKERGRW